MPEDGVTGLTEELLVSGYQLRELGSKLRSMDPLTSSVDVML